MQRRPPRRASGGEKEESDVKEVGIDFCDNKEIFYIYDDGEYYLINGSEGYPKKKSGYWRMPLSITNPLMQK